MKKYIVKLLFVFLILGSLSAQNFVNGSGNYSNNVKSSGTVRILAVMVEFQEDRDSETYGNGKFGSHYSKDYGNSIIDPLPHNAQYFSDHLIFAKNYFQKVSNGLLDIDYTVLPQIYTVSKTMRNYSPPNESENLNELGEFSEEVWTLVANDIQAPSFNDFDLFFIFHAGVSKGVITTGSLGLERDIPSIYLGLQSLQNIFGDDFNGFVTNKGTITNTAILPETDSREQLGFNETVLIELSINGYICATIGSYLGIPDLYDTKTGKSSIGRFGLMDPQGFYAYNGLFPPEPSGWVKEFLGWINPQVVTLDQTVNLVPYRNASLGEHSVVKIPINSSEYYLVERRSRDAQNNGSIITYKVNGEVKQKSFQFDQNGYRYYDIDSLEGVIIDVDEFDWALPGTDSDDEAGEFEDIGLIIWHIDEAVIQENLISNTINADRKRRGVFVVEADGIYDIGEDFVNILTGLTETREAIKEDTWYPSNPSELYKNIFNFKSNPPAITNLGVNSFIEMKEFSVSNGVYSFNVSFGNEFVKRLGSVELNNFAPFKWLINSGTSNTGFYIGNDERTFLVNLNGDVQELNAFSKYQPALISFNQKDYLVFAEADKIKILPIDDFSISIEMQLEHEITSPITIVNFNASNGTAVILLGTAAGEFFKFNLTLDPQLSLSESSVTHFSNSEEVKQISSSPDGNAIAVITNSAVHYLVNDITVNKAELNFIALSQNQIGNYDYVALSGNEEISISLTEIETSLPGVNNIQNLVLSNLQNSGYNSILFTNKNKLYALNESGALVNNFPFTDNLENDLTGFILTADINSDSFNDVFVFTEDGRVNVVSGNDGKAISNFSFSTGSHPAAAPLIFERNGKIALAVLDNLKTLSVWEINADADKIEWSGLYGNSFNQSSQKAASASQKITQFFPETKAYNWPNPVYDNETYIRFFVAEESNVSVMVFDLAGELVEDIPSRTFPGGFDSEITWNVSQVSSGVYFARIEANSTQSGNNAFKIIKIAVIK